MMKPGFASSACSAPTRTLTITAIGLWIATGVAQAAAQDPPAETDQRLLQCAEIRDTADRVACFDAVVQGLEPTASPAPAALPAADDAAPGPESPAPVAAPVAIEAAPDQDAPDSAMEDFGLERENARAEEEARNKQGEDISISATIVQSEKSGANHFVVLLDNGQVWEETDGSRRPGLPKVGLPVNIYKGRFGGYRMKIGDDNRIAWVRRLR